jgi:hypothetical protein
VATDRGRCAGPKMGGWGMGMTEQMRTFSNVPSGKGLGKEGAWENS